MAKKRRWNAIEEKRIKEEIELQSYINNLIIEDKKRQVFILRDQKYLYKQMLPYLSYNYQ